MAATKKPGPDELLVPTLQLLGGLQPREKIEAARAEQRDERRARREQRRADALAGAEVVAAAAERALKASDGVRVTVETATVTVSVTAAGVTVADATREPGVRARDALIFDGPLAELRAAAQE